MRIISTFFLIGVCLFSITTNGLAQNQVGICLELSATQNSANLPSGVSALVFENRTRWWAKNTVTVSFIGGDNRLRDLVKKYAVEWSKYGKITFDFTSSPNSDIRVSFMERNGHWSYVGTDAETIPKNQPTMNLDRFSNETDARRVILHEFGHSIGFVHEHQHPKPNIPWRIKKEDFCNTTVCTSGCETVYDYYKWSKEEVDQQVLRKFTDNQTNFSEYDPTSIMHYSIPACILTDPSRAVGWNTELSTRDKSFFGQMYPGEAYPRHRILYGSGNNNWTVADRLIGRQVTGYKVAVSGDFRGSSVGDEVLLIDEATGTNLLLYQDGVDNWRVQENFLPAKGVNNYSNAVSYDFDGNGKIDIFFVNQAGDNRLFLQNNSGFSVKGEIAGKTAVNGYDNVVANDFDGNGKGDLFFINKAGENRLMLQNTNGTFSSAGSIAGEKAVNGYDNVVANDFDGNGLMDLFFVNFQGDNRLMLQSSKGVFKSNDSIQGQKAVNGYNFVVSDDFNGDNRADLLFLNINSGENRLIYQSKEGRFDNINSLVGNKGLNNYGLAVAGKFDSSNSKVDVFLFQP